MFKERKKTGHVGMNRSVNRSVTRSVTRRKSPETVARSIMFHAATRVLADAARKRRDVVPPRGMGGSGLPFVRDADEPNGRRRNVLSLDPIPSRRAIRVGPHTFDKRHLKRLLAHTPRARNPLTRQPIPRSVRQRLGVPVWTRRPPPGRVPLTPGARRVLREADTDAMLDLVRRVLRYRPPQT